jgi:hypothetical protein
MIRNTAKPVVALLLAGLIGCAKSAADTPLPTVTITAHEFGYQIPAVIPAGVSRIQIVNQGQELHHVQLVRLAEGHTAADLGKAIEGGTRPDWAIPVGGPNAAQPGDTSATIQSLEPGHYVALCFIPGADKVPHFMKGMVQEFDVVGGNAASRATEPKADVTVQLADYSFHLSGPVRAGHHVIAVENTGPQEHEVVIARIEDGKTLEDLLGWVETMSGPPPGSFLGGVVGLTSGGKSYIDAHLIAGNYALICFVPDAKDGKPHLMHGMVTQFKVDPA